MLPIPNLPTDNLYKFVSLAGVFMVTVGIVTPLVVTQKERQWQHARHQQMADRMFDFSLRWGKYINDTYHDKPDEFKKMHKEGMAIVEGYNYAELAAVEKEEKDREKDYRVQMLGCYTMAGVGVCLSALGFWLWWSRIQRLQDCILMLERTRLERSLSADSSTTISPG